MSTRPAHAVIAGGGFAGLEALLALRVLVGHRVQLTLVTRTLRMVDRPTTVAEPFDRAVARVHDIQAIAADQGAELLLDRVVSVEPRGRTVGLASGRRLDYDALVVATGAGAVEALPGALTFRGPDDVAAMRQVIADLRTGLARSAAFALPGTSSWPMPIYELALMTGAELRADRVERPLTIVTPEPRPLAIFGPRAAEALEPLLEQRRVAVRAGSLPVRVEPGRLIAAGGEAIPADRVVALAAPAARPLVGLPTDAEGFVPVDAHGRVVGAEGVYAAGDAIAFPLKQGGLATQQADAVAEAIAAELGALDEPRPFRPVVRGLLLVGGAPLYLRAEVGRPGATAAEPVASGSAASDRALWWPPAKVAGRYLGPYLSTARPDPLGASPLADLPATGSAARPGSEHAEAMRLALALADGDAAHGDFDAAVRALEAGEVLDGALPPEYAGKRERWLAAR